MNDPFATAQTTGSSRLACTPVTCSAFSARSSPRIPADFFAATFVITETSSRIVAMSSNNISRPLELTDDETEARIAHCQKRLDELKPVAPLLRTEHLNKLLADAVARRQHKRMLRIKEIIRNEGQRRKWGSVKQCTKPRRGGAPTRIKVKGEGGAPDELYETREEVEEQASIKLKARFKLARDAPICQDISATPPVPKRFLKVLTSFHRICAPKLGCSAS